MARDIELKRELRTVHYLLKGRPVERKVEVRFDPITGRRCRILEKALLVLPGTDFSEILDETDCPFCGVNLEEGTPRFPEDIVPEGRIREGKAVLIPNMFPYADHTAVIVFKEHYKSLEDFPVEELADAFRCAKRYIELVHRADPKARFCSVNWNYMPPSGGTVLHPHHQIIVDRYPTFLQELMIKGSEARPGLWDDYVAKERDLDLRYIAKVGKVHLLAPFAPMGFDQVDGIFEGVTSIPDLTKKDLEDLASAVNQILGFYGHLKRSSFNMALYSSPLDNPPGEGPMWLNFKMLGRSNLRPYYRSDAGYTERLHYESVVNKAPELVASQMKDYLKKRNQ